MKAFFCILFIAFLNVPSKDLVDADAVYQLVVFEGSDWCSNCIRLEKNILSDTAIVDFLEKNKIKVLRVDFPQRKKISKKKEKENERIAEKYKFSGAFPELVVVKSGTDAFEKITYKNQSSSEFIAMIQQKIEELE